MRFLKPAVLLGVGAAVLNGVPALASSHAEAPMIAEDPKADNTDVYFFRSPQDPSKVAVLANYIPLQEPGAGPTYHYFSDQVLYEIHVDRNSDGREDMSFQFRFTTKVQTPDTFLSYLGPITQLTTNGSTVVDGKNVNPNYNRYQTYTLSLVDQTSGRARTSVLARDVIVPPNHAGPTTTPNFAALTAQAIHTVGGSNIRSFAGQIDDPFFFDVGATFDLLRVRPFRSLHLLQPVDPRPDRPDAPAMLSGYNCHTIALEIPINLLTGKGSIPGPMDPARILGVYASASRQRMTVISSTRGPRATGSFVQVSRLGIPLVNELHNPLVDSQGKGRTRDAYNQTKPRDDARFRRSYEFPETALRLAQLYPALRPVIPNITPDAKGFTGPRNDLLGAATPLVNFVPDLLRLDVSVPVNPNPNPLGVLGGDLQGFPNGRRLADDVIDIGLRVVAGALVPGNITVNGQTTTRAAFLNAINLGDGVALNDDGRKPFLNTFPFAATAHDGVLPAHIGFDDPEKSTMP